MSSNMNLLQAELAKMGKTSLSTTITDVDRIIDLLVTARKQVEQATDPHTASLVMTKLQNPISKGFESLNNNLKEVNKGHKNFGKVLDKTFDDKKQLPTTFDFMAKENPLINRAIAMHLLREGQFSVATTFQSEAGPLDDRPPSQLPEGGAQGQGVMSINHVMTTPAAPPPLPGEDTDMTISGSLPLFPPQQLPSDELQGQFANMYTILRELKARNLVPAIEWARQNSAELEARGSNLEFELCKLRFVWLFKGGDLQAGDEVSDEVMVDDVSPDDGFVQGQAMENLARALAYARKNFAHFQDRHLKEMQKLFGALVFASNMAASPYRNAFDTSSAFRDVALSFTREFCSLLGLSAESPLHVAVTAGAMALPRLIKYEKLARGTEWTTHQEQPFETPLPESMIYHAIFVCPVSKEQATELNPPMLLPCGHVVCRDSLQRLTKGSRFKCPYCPSEGRLHDAGEVYL